MHIICMLLASLAICAPAKPYDTEYSQAESDKALHKMEFCAGAVAAFPIPLPDADLNAMYTKCLLDLEATI
nr:hypothetical protein [Pseudomonas sp. UBA6718]